MTTSADYALQAVKGISHVFNNAAKNRLMEYAKTEIFDWRSSSELSTIFTSTESMSGVKELAETETPPTLSLEDGYSVTLTEKRFGGGIALPESTYRRAGRDMTIEVDEYLKNQRDVLLLTTTNYMLRQVFLMLNEAFDNTSDYLAPDGVELCGTHSWASGATFGNAATAALDEDAMDAAEEYAGAFTDAAGIPFPLSWDTIVVKKGSDAERTAKRLFAKEISPTAVADINVYEGMLRIVSTPYITSTNKNFWFLMDTSKGRMPLHVGIGEYPTLREPIKDKSETITTNATGFWKQGVSNMPYCIYGSNGTT